MNVIYEFTMPDLSETTLECFKQQLLFFFYFGLAHLRVS
jgi:hypothetical protein